MTGRALGIKKVSPYFLLETNEFNRHPQAKPFAKYFVQGLGAPIEKSSMIRMAFPLR